MTSCAEATLAKPKRQHGATVHRITTTHTTAWQTADVFTIRQISDLDASSGPKNQMLANSPAVLSSLEVIR